MQSQGFKAWYLMACVDCRENDAEVISHGFECECGCHPKKRGKVAPVRWDA